MALSPGILKDIGLDFRSGKLSKQDYEHRRDACTKKHLNELLSSPEYMDWMQSRSRSQKQSTSAGDIFLVSVIILVAAVIIAQPLMSVMDYHKQDNVEVLTNQNSGVQNLELLLKEFKDTGAGLEQVEAALDETQSALQGLINAHAKAEQTVTRVEFEVQAMELFLHNDSVMNSQDILSATKVHNVTEQKHWRSGPLKADLYLQALLPYGVPALIISGVFLLVAIWLIIFLLCTWKYLVSTVCSSLSQARHSLRQPVLSKDGKHEEPSVHRTADTVLTWVTGKGPLDEEVRALRDEVARVVCTNSGQLKMLRAELLAVEEERSAEAALHDRELTQLERQLADEVSRKEATAQQAKRWLDQAQGQLQNTQTALTVKEAEVKELSAQLDQAAADYARLRETSAHYAEDAAAAEALRVQLALQEEECGRLSKELTEAHDNLAALHLEAQEAATQACLQAEEGIVERDQKILALTNELELVQEVLTKLSEDLADAKAEVLQLQEDLQAKTEECDQISQRLKESEELSKLARSSSGSAEPSQVSLELAGDICLTCKDSNVAKLHADLEKERAATQELQEQLLAANSTVAQLQGLIGAADAREAQLLAMTQHAGQHVGSVMQMMKNTRHSLERKIHASQGAVSALTVELDMSSAASQVPDTLRRGQENIPLEEPQSGHRYEIGQPRTPLQSLQVQSAGDSRNSATPLTDETPLLMHGYPAPAIAARIKSAARSPYWFAKG
eukprot:jgi/Botrbrau1/10777/Bobra.0119s0004.2